MEGTPVKSFSRPPRLGEHNSEILTNILGYSLDQIESLRQKNIIKVCGEISINYSAGKEKAL